MLPNTSKWALVSLGAVISWIVCFAFGTQGPDNGPGMIVVGGVCALGLLPLISEKLQPSISTLFLPLAFALSLWLVFASQSERVASYSLSSALFVGSLSLLVVFILGLWFERRPSREQQL